MCITRTPRASTLSIVRRALRLRRKRIPERSPLIPRRRPGPIRPARWWLASLRSAVVPAALLYKERSNEPWRSNSGSGSTPGVESRAWNPAQRAGVGRVGRALTVSSRSVCVTPRVPPSPWRSGTAQTAQGREAAQSCAPTPQFLNPVCEKECRGTGGVLMSSQPFRD